ncbi:thiol peroxidase [Spiroplasma endosymbiont of Clivina fossor]|uniref:thiol peroxidase n=1 Tax=Spiroplasma endosymbiont of Clivina fossor TaxID=3066282 RepID=UPI00313E699C
MEVKMKGKPLQLIKEPIKIGETLNFIATNLNMSDFKITDIVNKKKVISVVPSVDTNTCLIQTKHMNKNISKLENMQLITISRDLPFAQNRACESFKDNNHILISDYKYRDFGIKTGLVIQKLELLARTLLVLDENNIIIYIDINEETSVEPNYAKLWDFLNK